MRREIYNDYDIQVLQDDDHYYVRYDNGTIATQIVEIPVTYEEAAHIMQLKSCKETRAFLYTTCYDRWKNPTHVIPSEYVGDTVKLMMD